MEVGLDILALANGSFRPIAASHRRLLTTQSERSRQGELGRMTRMAVDAWRQKQRFSPNIVLEANSIAILNNVLKQCRLATLLLDAIVREQAGLRELRTILSLPGRTVVLYRRNNGYHSVAADAFAKLVSVLRTRVCLIAWAKIVGSGSIASRPL